MLLKLILKPLSWIYALILKIRHIAYDRGFFYSKSFAQPIIKVGNLALGGTGKSPMTLYLAAILCDFHPTILSRGYKRDLKGFQEVNSNSIANHVGDEPWLFKNKMPEIRVFLDEDRVRGIEEINQRSSSQVPIILDDALQHRRLLGGIEILLTEMSKPFYDDELLPSGGLRDLKSRARAADIIVVTKCDHSLNREEMEQKILKYSNARVLFSDINYLPYRDFFLDKDVSISRGIAVSAIANNSNFIQRLLSDGIELEGKFLYPDHYNYLESDVKKWFKVCLQKNINSIICTEKDAAKLNNFKTLFSTNKIQLIVLPIEISFSAKDAKSLRDTLVHYIEKFDK